MHIGFDISQTGSGKAGCGYFAHALIQSLLELAPEHCYRLYPSFGDFYFDGAMPKQCPYTGRDIQYGTYHTTLDAARGFWSTTGLEALLGAPDLIHSNNFWAPLQLHQSRLIYTFYDMGFAVEPNWTTEFNRVGCFEGVFRSSVAADWIVAISEASRAHYLSVFPHFPESRIRVIYPCSRFPDAEAVGERPDALEGIPEGRFWLSVGTIEPRKNQRRLAQAYSRYLSYASNPMPLVMVGGKGWLMEDFQIYLNELSIANHVLMTGYLSDAELIWLYRNCYANIYPSLFEGFGLPILEGMQFGAATLSSNKTSLPEVAGSAAILLSPEDIEAWSQAMLDLAGNEQERCRLGAAARHKAAEFNWKSSAAALLNLYQEALATPKRGLLK